MRRLSIVLAFPPRCYPEYLTRLVFPRTALLCLAGFLAAGTVQRRGYEMPVAQQVLLLPGGLAALGAGFLILRFSRPRSARGAYPEPSVGSLISKGS